MNRIIRLAARRALIAAGLGLLPAHACAGLPAAPCVSPASWVVPTGSAPQQRDSRALMAELATRPVVLLGESHDNAEHHRWQLHTIAGLYALRPDLVLGFEMFPRRVQKALDQWVAGELSEEEFLKRSEWNRVWGFDARLYLPIFDFARMHRVPMIALNVERSLVARVGELGWAGIPQPEREGVSDPAAPSAAYREALYESYLEHLPQPHPARGRAEPDYTDPAFLRFVEGMQLWDRAMAQAIAQRRSGTAPASGRRHHGQRTPGERLRRATPAARSGDRTGRRAASMGRRSSIAARSPPAWRTQCSACLQPPRPLQDARGWV